MRKDNNVVIKEKFLWSYKSFINFITLTHKNQNMYNILVLRKNSGNGLVTVSVIVRNCNNDEGLLNEFSNNVMLTAAEANSLVDDIRNDFKNNHPILYCVINTENYIQTIQNSNFSLNIKLISEHEFGEALEFNSEINCKNAKHRVLSRN